MHKTCTVPEIKDSDGATVRPATIYFSHKTDPASGGTDGTDFLSAESLTAPADDASLYKLWTAALTKSEADTALASTTWSGATINTLARTRAQANSLYTEKVRAMTWR